MPLPKNSRSFEREFFYPLGKQRYPITRSVYFISRMLYSLSQSDIQHFCADFLCTELYIPVNILIKIYKRLEKMRAICYNERSAEMHGDGAVF